MGSETEKQTIYSEPDFSADAQDKGTDSWQSAAPNLQRQDRLSELPQEREVATRVEDATQESLADTLASPEQNWLERMGQLEQALEQSLASLSELRLKLKDQHLLETQLAATEEIANVQQQAITELQRQLSQQQQSLEVQITATQAQEQIFQNLLTGIETIAKTQELEIGRLKNQLADNRAAFRAYHKQLEQQLEERQTALEAQQQRVMELETQTLAARTLAVSLEVQITEASRQIETLRQTCSDRTAALNQQSVELEQEQWLVSEQSTTIASLNQDLITAQVKIEALETQLHQQHTAQARLQHRFQETEMERDRALVRLTQLEQQTGVLQEQLLASAQQAGEYEAAVQYWKDRYNDRQHQALQLKEALERLLPERGDEVLDLLRAIQPPAPVEAIEPVVPKPTLPSRRSKNQPLQVDLPGFLTRRRPQ